MRSTIGFGLKIVPQSFSIDERLEQIADKFKYKLLLGLDKAEANVKEGIQNLVEAYNLDNVYILKAPISALSNFSEEIQEELNGSYFNNKEINFFKFLQEASLFLQEGCEVDLIFFFAYEWDSLTRVRIIEGAVDDLVMVLDNPVDWQLPLYDLKSKITYAESSFPLVYILKKS